jgi:hypothetical protein
MQLPFGGVLYYLRVDVHGPLFALLRCGEGTSSDSIHNMYVIPCVFILCVVRLDKNVDDESWGLGMRTW